ncbi:MAG: DUF5658 family protein [Planctomycetota bacterium]|jgi:hypothetical protein
MNHNSSRKSADESDAAAGSASEFNLQWLQWWEAWLFVVLSAADIGLTYLLIGHFGHVEGNPVARYFVEGWGLKGMIWFKLGLVSVILGVCHVVRPIRPRTARVIVQFGLIAAAAVVIYSVVLLLRAVS